MKIYEKISRGYGNISMHEILRVCSFFYHKYKVIPDTVKLNYRDMMDFCNVNQQKMIPLEAGKTYSMYVPIVGGFAELVLLSEEEETNIPDYDPNCAYIVVESSSIDRAFEKHILKLGD